MSPNRLRWTMLWALLTAITLAPCAVAQPRAPRVLPSPVVAQSKPAEPAVDDQGLSCVIYGLADLGDDLGAWVAKTMPGVIQPASWSDVGGAGVISYYAPAKMLVVYQSPAVHVQIDAFLKNVKKSLPAMKSPMAMPMAHSRDVMPAHYVVTAESGPAATPAATGKGAYPIPAPLQQPKHLFHFIIRYEGDGVIDSNLSALAKALVGDASVSEEKSDKSKSDPAKSLSQLFNIILRYEGEGIIDENVAEVIKAIHAMQNSPHTDPVRQSVPTAPVTPPTDGTMVPANVQSLPAALSAAGSSTPPSSTPPSWAPAPVSSAPAMLRHPAQYSAQFTPFGSGYVGPLPQQLPHPLPQPVSSEPRLIMPPADGPASAAPTTR